MDDNGCQLRVVENVEGLTFPLISSIANRVMPNSDAFHLWFNAIEQCGEYIGIRYGHIAPGAKDPDWKFYPHSKCDGIGAFAEYLRAGGAPLTDLPRIKSSSPVTVKALFRNWPKSMAKRKPVQWLDFPKDGSGEKPEIPKACAWHVFDEKQTQSIRRVCWQLGVTVNSFLVHHLTHAIRPFLARPNSIVPWLLPVNMRGGVRRERDTDNHSSCICVKIYPTDPVHQTHRQIVSKLERGEHWANWYAYAMSRVITAGMRRWVVRNELCTPQFNLGSFSNLGNWDPEKRFSGPGITGDWLFCPPVLKMQTMGAGCVTFQGRMSLMVQAHAFLTTDSKVTQVWVRNWVQAIETDLRNILGETQTSAVPAYIAAA